MKIRSTCCQARCLRSRVLRCSTRSTRQGSHWSGRQELRPTITPVWRLRRSPQPPSTRPARRQCRWVLTPTTPWVIERCATLGQDYAWGYQTVGGFQYAFEAAGGDVVQKLWSPIGTTDYAPYVNDINQDVDAVYVTLIGADIPRFVQAYSDFGLKENIPMLTSEDLVAQDAIRFYSGDPAVGIVGITPFTANLDRPEMQAFVEAYQERTGNVPTFWGESSYVAAMVIDRSLAYVSEQNGIAPADLPTWVRENGQAFADASKEIDLSDAPSSAITVDAYNRQVRDFYIVELVDDGGAITDSLVETVPEVNQFWTFEEAAFLADPLFDRENPPE